MVVTFVIFIKTKTQFISSIFKNIIIKKIINMKQIHYLYFLISAVILFSCSSDKTDQQIKSHSTKDSTTISLKNLSFIKSQDFLKQNDSIIYLTPERLCEASNRNFVFYNKQNLFLTDLDLNVLKTISLTEKGFLIKGRVLDIEIMDKNILLLDNSSTIKVVPLSDENSISEIKLDIEGSKSKYMGAFTSIVQVDQNKLLATNTLQPFLSTQLKHSYEVGKMFDIDGNYLVSFEVSGDQVDPNWNKFFDLAYATSYNDKIYFSFLISRKIFVFSLAGKLLNSYELEVDKNYWHDINTETTSGETFGVKTTSIQSKFIPICNNALQIRNGFIYSLIFQGKHNGPKLVKYNEKFDIIEELSIDEIKSQPPEFKIYIIKDRLYLDNGIIHFFRDENAI